VSGGSFERAPDLERPVVDRSGGKSRGALAGLAAEQRPLEGGDLLLPGVSDRNRPDGRAAREPDQEVTP
jgi:hypothetical protein